jgi:hypothetical protein
MALPSRDATRLTGHPDLPVIPTVRRKSMPRLSHPIHRLAIAGGAAASFFLSSCSESPSSPTREIAPGIPSLSQSQELADENGRHVFHTKQWNDNAQNDNGNAHGKPGGGGTSTGISYHGGPVLQGGTKVVAVYWGGGSLPIYTNGPTPGSTGLGTADNSLIGTFLRNLGDSPYFKINSTYTGANGQPISSSVTYTGFWANNTNVPLVTANVSDAQMAAMLASGFSSGKLTYDASTLYAIFTAGKTNLGGGFGSQYCAYHTHATISISGVARTVLYAAMPYDNAYPGGCSMGSPANGTLDPGADAEVNTLGHEIEETTTDMLGTAWFDNRGYENADKCAWTFGATYTTAAGGTANMNLGGKDFLVQQNWVNAGTGGCKLSYP